MGMHVLNTCLCCICSILWRKLRLTSWRIYAVTEVHAKCLVSCLNEGFFFFFCLINWIFCSLSTSRIFLCFIGGLTLKTSKKLEFDFVEDCELWSDFELSYLSNFVTSTIDIVTTDKWLSLKYSMFRESSLKIWLIFFEVCLVCVFMSKC